MPDGMLSVAGVVDPIRAPLNQVLEQLQSQSKYVNIMKGYVTAFSNGHVLIPAWDLQIVLKALKGFPFEPLWAASFKFLTWKTVLLLEITSVRRASELHALCYNEPYIAMTDPMVLLWPNIEFLPKVSTTRG